MEDDTELALDRPLWRLLATSGATHWIDASRTMMIMMMMNSSPRCLWISARIRNNSLCNYVNNDHALFMWQCCLAVEKTFCISIWRWFTVYSYTFLVFNLLRLAITLSVDTVSTILAMVSWEEYDKFCITEDLLAELQPATCRLYVRLKQQQRRSSHLIMHWTIGLTDYYRTILDGLTD